jgi:hypothetical protein
LLVAAVIAIIIVSTGVFTVMDWTVSRGECWQGMRIGSTFRC